MKEMPARLLLENSKALLSLVVIVPVGFYTKLYTGPAELWVRNSLGGVFYEIFWCLVLFIFFKRLSPMAIAVTVLLITCILELMQLWHPPVLEIIRGTFIGRTILGTTFMWSDFPYYFIGSGIGWLWLKLVGASNRSRKLLLSESLFKDR